MVSLPLEVTQSTSVTSEKLCGNMGYDLQRLLVCLKKLLLSHQVIQLSEFTISLSKMEIE